MKKDLGIIGLSFFLICNIIGAGVFFLQQVILLNTDSVKMSLFCWIFAAFIAILFGMCYSELGSAYPEEGGDVVYFHKAYGAVACIVFSIVSVYIILPLGCALMTQLICKSLYEAESFSMHASMLALLVILAICNYFGNRLIIKVQQFLTILKVIIVTIFVVLSACVFFGYIKVKGEARCAMEDSSTPNGTYQGIAIAMFSTLWSYDGWNAGNFVAHRIINPSRTLPIAITFSIIVVTLLYLAINISFFSVLSSETIKFSKQLLVFDYFHSLEINEHLKKFLTGFVSIIPSLGTLNGSYIVVMSILDGLIANKDNKNILKLGGLVLFTGITYLACLMKSPESIITKISFCVYVFYGMSIYAITILRKKESPNRKVFRAPTLIVYACVGISAAVVVFSLYKQLSLGG